MSDDPARPTRTAPAPRYREPARSYASTALLAALILAGFVIDLVIGGAGAHLAAWGGALLLVAGIDALTVHAARSLRTLTVTDTEIRVGEHTLARAEVVAAEPVAADAAGQVLGRTASEGLPRGLAGLKLQCADGRHVIVATRRPDRLAAALGFADAAASAATQIRPAEPAELAGLVELSQRSEALYRVSGMSLPHMVYAVDSRRDAATVLVRGRPPVGFVRISEFDGQAHIVELAVLPSHMRQGVGAALLEAACAWARERGSGEITVVTYADVPWNAPYYERHGFAEVGEPLPRLAELRDWERAAGMDELGRRVTLRRLLAP